MTSYSINLGSVGKRIRYLRAILDMNQVELTRELQKRGVTITNQYVSELERTNKVPSGEVIAGLAQVLGTTTDFLLLLTDDAAPAAAASAQGEVVSPQPADQIVYQIPSAATRQLAQRLLTTFSELNEAERTFVVEIAEKLRAITKPRIIGDDLPET